MTLKNNSAIAGIGFSDFGMVYGKSHMRLTLDASKAAIEDSGLNKDDIDGVIAVMPAVMGEQHGWATRVAAHLGLTPKVSFTADMGGATCSGMIQTAALYINAGMASAVLVCFGNQNNPQGQLMQLMGSSYAFPYGDIGAIPFMGHIASVQMEHEGITQDPYGEIAATFRKHAGKNPNAQKQKPFTIEDHNNSRFVAEPLRLFDCCLVTDGGGAIIVTSRERAKDLKNKSVIIQGAGQEHGADMIEPHARPKSTLAGSMAANSAFEMAGCDRKDIDAAMIYDGFTPLVVHCLAAFGFAQRGEVGPYLASGALRLEGALPTNTHGGLLSDGHLFGFGPVAEATRQIRGTADGRQLDKTDLIFVNGFGGAPHEAPPTLSYSTLILSPDA